MVTETDDGAPLVLCTLHGLEWWDIVNGPPCPTCGGQGCEEGCGHCEMANAGPDSHRVCRTCHGSGQAA